MVKIINKRINHKIFIVWIFSNLVTHFSLGATVGEMTHKEILEKNRQSVRCNFETNTKDELIVENYSDEKNESNSPTYHRTPSLSASAAQ